MIFAAGVDDWSLSDFNDIDLASFDLGACKRVKSDCHVFVGREAQLVAKLSFKLESCPIRLLIVYRLKDDLGRPLSLDFLGQISLKISLFFQILGLLDHHLDAPLRYKAKTLSHG